MPECYTSCTYHMGPIFRSSRIARVFFFFRKRAFCLPQAQVLLHNKKFVNVSIFFQTCLKKRNKMYTEIYVESRCLCLKRDRFFSSYDISSFVLLFTIDFYHSGQWKTIAAKEITYLNWCMSKAYIRYWDKILLFFSNFFYSEV